MRFLIVEDEMVSRKKMQIILEEFGVCDMTANGVEALELFRKGWEKRMPYDIVTLDITLHEMNGIDVLLGIRQYENEMHIQKGKRTKVIMVTSYSDVDHINACVTAGCNNYMVKPFTREAVCKCLRAVFLKYVKDVFP